VTVDDNEPLMPLDPDKDPLAAAADASKNQNQPEDPASEDSETFEILEPEPASSEPETNSQFADPLLDESASDSNFEFTPEKDTQSKPSADPFELDAEEFEEDQNLEKLPPREPKIKFKTEKVDESETDQDSSNSAQSKGASGSSERIDEEGAESKQTPHNLKELCEQTCANGEQIAGKMRTIFRLPEPKPPTDDWRGKFVTILRPVVHCLFGLLYLIYSYLASILNYYIRNRKGIWFFILDVAKHVPPTDVYQREIRINEKEGLELKYLKGDNWKIPLATRCIKCGNSHGCDVQKATFRVENFERVGIGFLAGLFISIMLSIFTWNLWYFFGAPLVGLIVGYFCRKPVKVRIEYWTCPEHQKQTDFPQLRLYSGELFILVGHMTVRRDYIQELEAAGLAKRR